MLYNNTCVCKDGFEKVNGTCKCPEGKTESNGTCIGCDIMYCELCEKDNECSKCMDTFMLYNNTCVCKDTF